MISVCIATYNGEKYIEAQLRSILGQLQAEDEVIISDGGSGDGTIACVEAIGDKRIRLVHLPADTHADEGVWPKINRIRRNFENAMRQARGGIIFFSDQDDIWQPDKVARVLAAMDEQTVCIVHDARVTDAALQVTHESVMAMYKPSFSRWGVLWKSPYMGCCMAVRREVVEQALPVPEGMEYDTWLGCMARKMGRIRFLREPLILYRRHDDVASWTGLENKNAWSVKIQRRYNILKNCIQRL